MSRIDTHPPFGYVDDDVRERHSADSDFPGNLEEKLDGLQRTYELAGGEFDRERMRRILTGQEASPVVHVDNRGIAHKTKKAKEEANRKYGKPYTWFPFGAIKPLTVPVRLPRYTFEDAYKDAVAEIAAAKKANKWYRRLIRKVRISWLRRRK